MPGSFSNISSGQTNEPPPDLRELKLTLQYFVKRKANIDNPAFECVFNPQYENSYYKNKKCNWL